MARGLLGKLRLRISSQRAPTPRGGGVGIPAAGLYIDTGYPEDCSGGDTYQVEDYEVCIRDGRYYVRDYVLPEEAHLFTSVMRSILFEEEEVSPAYRRLLSRIYGYGVLDPLVKDEDIIDIHIVPGEFVQVVHKKHGRLVYPITFSETDAIELARKLATKAGIPVNEARPLVSFIDPEENARVSIVFHSDVSLKRTYIDIRKQPRNPYTVFDLIKFKTLEPYQVVVAWFAIKHKLPILITGGMFSGKTTLATALTTLMPPGSRVITIEDAPELRIPKPVIHLRTMTRSFSGREGYEVTVFDLIKIALRMSVDYVVVGEVRGAEARDWAQAILLGHGGLTTFHATSPEAALERLRVPPISVDEETLSYLAVIFHVVVSGTQRRARLYTVTRDLRIAPVNSIDDFLKTHHVEQVASLYGAGREEMASELNAMSDAVGQLSDSPPSFDEAPLVLYTLLARNMGREL